MDARSRVAARSRCALTGQAVLAAGLLALVGVALGVVVLVGCGSETGEARPVTLQLNWYHEAEFMGYYLAQDKGFFAEEGLAVTIHEGGPPAPPAREAVLSRQAAFAITSFAEQRDLVSQGQDTVAVFSAFQIPPLVIFSLTDTGIVQPADLAGKRVGTTTDYWKRVLEETLTAASVDPASVTTVDVEPHELPLLYQGELDAWLGYAQDEPIRAQVAGHTVRQIFPADFGVGGYEGLIITQQTTVDEQPDLVRRFLRAAQRGWRYAVEHPAEAAEILVDWAGNTLEFQRLAVNAVAPLVDTPQVPLGWIEEARWRQLMGTAYQAEHPGYTMALSPESP